MMLAPMTEPVPRVNRNDEDLILELAYRAEFSPTPEESAETLLSVAGRSFRAGDLRAMAIQDVADRVLSHQLLRRADDSTKLEALRFVERRIADADKVLAYDQSGAFGGFLRRVIHNLLLDWIRSPTGRAELKRVEHDPTRAGHAESDADFVPPSEIFQENRARTMNHLIAIRAVRSMPAGKAAILRLALWPAFPIDENDQDELAAFAHCHETAKTQADARSCDAGRRCVDPEIAWKTAYLAELTDAQAAEPEGLSRRSIAQLTRIGVGKSLTKREGAVCERVSKARMQLVEALRRAGIRGVES